MTSTPFNQLLAAHYLRAHRVALGFMGNEQEAREMAHDALLKAYNARDRYDQQRPFYPWLRRIVRNTCLDALQRRKKAPVSGYDTERVASADRRPDEVASVRDDLSRMRAAMDQIKPEYREILVMRHFEDLTYAEIGEALDLPAGTVMSRLFRARKALLEQMESA